MRRRRFLKAVLGAGVAAVIPIPVSGGELCDICAIGEGCGARYLIGGECPEDLEMMRAMKPLDDIFKRVYAGRITAPQIPTAWSVTHPRGLSDGIYHMPITLKHENGFTS